MRPGPGAANVVFLFFFVFILVELCLISVWPRWFHLFSYSSDFFFLYSSYHVFVLLSSFIVFFQGSLLSHTAIMYNQTWLNVVNASYNRIIVLVPHPIRESCRESGHEAKLPHTHHSSSGFDGIAITDSTPYCIADGQQPLNDRRIFFLW